MGVRRTGGNLRRRSRSSGIAIFVVLAAIVLVAGCGGPQFTYVKNADDRTYLKVPNTWRQIDPAQFTAVLGSPPANSSAEGTWIVGYDAATTPALDHMFDADLGSPVILVSVDAIPEKSRGQVSLDVVRDYRFPVSATARQQFTMTGASGGLSDFQLIQDEVLTPGHGIRGVHSVYAYRVDGGPPQIFDQLGYVNDDASKLYLAIARCSAQCFQQRQQEIEDVVNSFTVREDTP